MLYKSTQYLVKLIESLTPTEKRQFRVHMNRSGQTSDSLFMALFDHIDKYKKYDEELILKKIPAIKKKQLSNLKSTLYRQLLSTLRQLQRNTSINVSIRESIDYAVILYNKGLYNAALDALDKAKKMALEAKKYSSVITILELEKKIESLYVTGSMTPKAVQLKVETDEVLEVLNINHRLSNLSLSLYGHFLKRGFVKDSTDYDYIADYFKMNLPSVSVEGLDFYGKLYYYQSHVWYHFMVQDFVNYFRYASKWVDLFKDETRWVDHELTILIKGYHNVLNAAFMSQRESKFLERLDEFLILGEARLKKMNRDEYITYQSIKYVHEINAFFLNGQYAEGVEYIESSPWQMSDDPTTGWDLNRQLSSYFKVGCLYFCAGDHDRALECLHHITNNIHPDFREDIQCFARMLSLIIHYEQGNEALVSHQVISTYRYLAKREFLQEALRQVLAFLRRLPNTDRSGLREEFVTLKKNLELVQGQEFQQIPFLYLDIIGWLDSKIEGIPLQDALKKRIRPS